MKKQKYEIDTRLLECNFNPFQPVCETGRHTRDQPHEYRAFKDYLRFLKIIGNRLISDSKKYQQITSGDPRLWHVAYELQLDIESFVIFSHILLGKVGILMDKLLSCRNPHEWSYKFSKHREYYVNERNMCAHYSEILIKMHWYDQNFDFLRNKIIEHSRVLAGSMRNFKEYRKINKLFGRLSIKDQTVVQNFINKYGKDNNEILAIQPNPDLMLDEFLYFIMKYNIKLNKTDLDELGQIVQRTGATIDVTILSGHLRKFLEDIASLFPQFR